jgi:hypothetical protein
VLAYAWNGKVARVTGAARIVPGRRRAEPRRSLLQDLAGFDERAWEVQEEGPWARADSSYELVVVRASRPVSGELAGISGTASGASENTVR